jgi:GNAT superfamily N-acetyltransferase
MKLAFVTHAEHPKLRGTLPDVWPEFMAHDPVVQAFWPQLYDQYPDFQLWVVDREAGRRATVGYACSVPVGWNGDPSPRGIDWALTDGVEATPTTLCSIVAGVVPEYRGLGIAETILRRLAAIGAGHGLDALVAPVRPTWKDRYPLVALDRYAGWRRADGLPYDPWLRTHERLGGELVAMAPRSMTISGTRPEWEEWTGMVFPEDGNYVVPGALVPVHFKNGRGVYVEPNIWVRHPFG